MDVTTKQKEIEDLIVITDKLEADLKSSNGQAALFEKANQDLLVEQEAVLESQNAVKKELDLSTVQM